MESRIKVGIVTLYGENNYGNRLQNYAVHRVLSDKGYKCETIARQPGISKKNRVKAWLKKTACKTVPQLKNRRPHIFRDFSFKRFTKKYIPTRYYYTDSLQLPESISKEFDYFVVGSDQVWNPTFGNYERIINDMFLQFATPSQKVCFAPSFGVDDIPSDWQGVFKENLSTFPRISIREDSGAKIVRELTGKEAEVLIDPTMMLNKADWMRIAKPSIADTTRNYMLQYFLGNQNEAYRTQLDTISKQNDLAVYRLLDPSVPELYTAAPDEFIDLISKSSLICTDSFHAVVFSILFEKPFIIFQRDDKNADMSSRIITLLDKFGLEKRYYHEIRKEDILSIDYHRCFVILEKERERIMDFLNNSIGVKSYDE